ncbi:PIG-L deacetylase family protein [Candidatus Latescibacterota bacterium]
MERRNFFGKTALGGILLGSGVTAAGSKDALAAQPETDEIFVERSLPGKPYKGKVLAIVVDDTPLLCAGTCAKLVNEGYTAYLIRTTNNDKLGDGSYGENVLKNEKENERIHELLGISDVYEFYYRQHRLHSIPLVDIRFRMIFLFRYLKVDTVITYNPRGYGEENPDHIVTGQVVEEASWMAGIPNHLPEHFEAGVSPQTVNELYYMAAQPGQEYNRVVDIGSVKEQKIKVIAESQSQGKGNMGAELRKKLSAEGKRIPMLGDNNETANREFARNFLFDYYSTFDGIEKYGVTSAERFFYIDKRNTDLESGVEAFVANNAVKL